MNNDDFDSMEYYKKNHPEYHKQILTDRRLIARFEKADTLKKQGDLAGAILQLEMNMVDCPTWASVSKLMVLYKKVGRHDDEIKLLEQALVSLKDKNNDWVLQKIADRLEKAKKRRETKSP